MENIKNSIMYLGDIHGNFNLINQYVNQYKLKDCIIIQVGDFGVGFAPLEKERKTLGYVNPLLKKNNIMLYAIRGNHDFKPYFDNDPFGFSNIKLLPDYTILDIELDVMGLTETKKILFIGGAVSVDRNWRMTAKQKNGDHEVRPGQSWWQDEIFVLDNDKLADMRGIDIVVTHTAPDYCVPDNSMGFGGFVEGIIKDTGDKELKTDLLFERNQVTDAFHTLRLNGNDITHHYYGHFHRSDTINMYGVKHRLLGVGELWEERV
jgi:predicted phosphodiesterase